MVRRVVIPMYLECNTPLLIYLETNHYLFKKYLRFLHFSTAINNLTVKAYNGMS